MSRKDRDATPEKDDANRRGADEELQAVPTDKQDRVAKSEGDVAAERADDVRREETPIDPALTRATDRDIAAAQGAVTQQPVVASEPAGIRHPGGAANPDSPAAAAAQTAPAATNSGEVVAQNPNSNVAVGTHRPVNYSRPAVPQPGRC